MTEKVVKVGKIIIEIGKKEIPLTIEEVKALKSALSELLGETKTVTQYVPTWYDLWRPRSYGGLYGSLGYASGGLTMESSQNYGSQLEQFQERLAKGENVTLSYCANEALAGLPDINNK